MWPFYSSLFEVVIKDSQILVFGEFQDGFTLSINYIKAIRSPYLFKAFTLWTDVAIQISTNSPTLIIMYLCYLFIDQFQELIFFPCSKARGAVLASWGGGRIFFCRALPSSSKILNGAPEWALRVVHKPRIYGILLYPVPSLSSWIGHKMSLPRVISQPAPV